MKSGSGKDFEMSSIKRCVVAMALWALAILLAIGLATGTQAAELILPQGRQAYFADEPIELAAAGVGAAGATLEIVPATSGAQPVKVAFAAADGATTTSLVKLPPLALSPGEYQLKLDGADAGKLTIASGVHRSTLLVAQTTTPAGKGGSNFGLANAFSYGLLGPDGLPLVDVRNKRSASIASIDNWVAQDLPVVIYMYWTGFVTHKPWGTEKSWANAAMIENMRLFNFHTAQRLRRAGKAIDAVGPIDEPGLAWGKTPAGGSASGFPNWDEADWYNAHGWNYTNDISNQDDAGWLKYVGLRALAMKEAYAQAKQDIKAVWPDATFAGDLYAPGAIMDGTDPMNQQVNDVLTTHVFFDFFGGPFATTGLLYLEKTHDPLAPVAHAMNGQLEGVRGPQRPLYHALMNGMLAAGLHSNWWLNTGTMTPDDLAAVNEPAARLGPVFREMRPTNHDVAILWSHTQIAMSQKEMARLESTKATGTQIKLMVPVPEADEAGGKLELSSNAYEVGNGYVTRLMLAHQALSRAGYPTHLIDERVLADGALDRYKVLFVVEQTFPLPPAVMAAIESFVAHGGKVVTDAASTVKFPGTVVHTVDMTQQSLRARTALNQQKLKTATTARQTAHLGSNLYLNEPMFKAIAPFKAALVQTGARPALVSDAPDLLVERHVAGDGMLYMVLNGYEEIPAGADDQPFPRYNMAPREATFTLQGIPAGATVYRIEGLDWKTVSRVDNADQPQTARFEAGEMKLYLVAPRAPSGLKIQSSAAENQITVNAQLGDVKMPWPLVVTIAAPDGRELFHLTRSTDANGQFTETFPIGANAAAGAYAVRIESPVGGLSEQASAAYSPAPAAPATIADKARVLDKETIRSFLKTKPKLTVAVANDAQRPLAEKLAAQLKGAGIDATLKPAGEILRKSVFPRIWNPWVTVVSPAEEGETVEKMKIDRKLTVTADPSGAMTVTDDSGAPVASGQWKQPNTLVTVAGAGFVDFVNVDNEVCYEPGVQIYVSERNTVHVIKGAKRQEQANDAFKARWSRPWQKLTQYNGSYQLPPILPLAYECNDHLVLLGDSTSGLPVAALQASELLAQTVDAKYPGPGKALVQYAWSPFAVEKNVIFIGAFDPAGLEAGVNKVAELVR